MALNSLLRKLFEETDAGQTARTIGQSAVAEPVAGLNGLLALAATQNPDVAAEIVKKTSNALSYTPTRQGAQENLQAIGEFLAPVEEGKQWLGDTTLSATGSPALATAAYTAPDALLSLIGLKGMPKAGTSYNIGDIGTQASNIGGKQRGVFAGMSAKNAPLEKAFEASQRLDAGESPAAIFDELGIMRGIDDQMRFHIPDSNAKFLDEKQVPQGLLDELSKTVVPENKGSDLAPVYRAWSDKYGMAAHGKTDSEAINNLANFIHKEQFKSEYGREPFESAFGRFPNLHSVALGDLLDHPELFAAYPDLAGLRVRPMDTSKPARGSWNPTTRTIELNPKELDKFRGDLSREQSWMSTLLHEVQHAIQGEEGFGRGYNTDASKRVLDEVARYTRNQQDKSSAMKREIETIRRGDEYSQAVNMQRTASALHEQDRLRGYLKDMGSGGKLTDKRRHILNAGSALLDHNTEAKIRRSIDWPKKHRPQGERDAAYNEYIIKVLEASNERLDPAIVDAIRADTVKNPAAKYKRQLMKLHDKEIGPMLGDYMQAQKDLSDARNFLDQYSPYTFYKNVGGEVEANIVQDMFEDPAITNPYRSKSILEYPPQRQFNILQDEELPTNVGILQKIFEQ